MMHETSMLDLFSLKDRVAVITGGGGMLGYQHAAAIASLGGKTALLDINPEGLLATAKRLRTEFATDALTIPVDITDLDAVAKSKSAVLEEYGRLDILINNAAR